MSDRAPESIGAADLELLRVASAARGRAHAPYSRFAVGAAVRTSSGRSFPGCNVENATNGLTLCAERVAVFSAISAGEPDIEAIAVVVEPGRAASPCGICRELIREFAPGSRIILSDGAGGATLASIDALLPEPEGEGT